MKRFSGKLQLRTDPKLHEQLAKQATRRGLSLNYFINQLLQEGLAHQTGKGLDFIEWLNRLQVPLKSSSFTREDAYSD